MQFSNLYNNYLKAASNDLATNRYMSVQLDIIAGFFIIKKILKLWKLKILALLVGVTAYFSIFS